MKTRDVIVAFLSFCLAGGVLTHLGFAGDNQVLEWWEVLSADSKKRRFEVLPSFCFSWDGLAAPALSQQEAIAAAQANYGLVYGHGRGAPARVVKSVKLVRRESGAAYYQVILGAFTMKAFTGMAFNLPIAVGKGGQVLLPTRTTMVWKKEDEPAQGYWGDDQANRAVFWRLDANANAKQE
jgi:hypothetical protein